MAIATLSETKSQLNIESSNTAHDEELGTFIDSADAVVERYRGEVVVQREVVDYKQIDHPRPWLTLASTPVDSLTTITDLDTSQTWDITKIQVEPTVGTIQVLTERNFSGYLEIVYDAGYALVPHNYKLAALIIIQHLWSTQRGSIGPPAIGNLESTIQGGGTAAMGFAIPNRAIELLGGKFPGVA